MKRLCLENVGAWPQVAATRKEYDLNSKVLFDTELSDEEYERRGQEFESPLFAFTMKNFNVKRKEFCYAGAWTFQLNLITGVLKPCYHAWRSQNIYEDISNPIYKRPVGCSCGSLFCMNSCHFMSLGVIPEIETPTYAALRIRKEGGWYNPKMEAFLNGKLASQNVELNDRDKRVATFLGRI